MGATEFLPMETDTTKSSIRLKTVTNKNNNNNNRASHSSSSSKSSSQVRFSNNYLFSSSVMSELSLASQNLSRDTIHPSFRKSLSMTDLNASSSNISVDNDDQEHRSSGGDNANIDIDKSMADSTTGCSWIKGYNPVASDLNPWMSESNRSMFSEISMDLLALDLAGDNKPSSLTNGGNSVIMKNES